jgi:hypothetical protein
MRENVVRNALRSALIGGLCAWLTACANRPETIHASYVSHEKFMDLDCPVLAVKMSDTRADLEKFSKIQDSKATGDAWGVFLLGIPFSKLSGDVEGEVARLKGEVEAISTAQIKKGCTGVIASNAPTVNASTSASVSVADAKERLELLRDMKAKGLLSDEEFNLKRADLANAVLGVKNAAGLSAAPRGDISGLRLLIRDSDPISKAKTSESLVTIDALSERGTVMNGGTTSLDRTGHLLTGTVPLPHVEGLGGGRLQAGMNTRALLVPVNSMPPIDVDVHVVRLETMRLAERDVVVARCEVSGFTSHTALPATRVRAAGAKVSGEITVEPATGLVISARLQSSNAYYAFVRESVAAPAP